MLHGRVTAGILIDIYPGKRIPRCLYLAALYHDIEREEDNPINTKNCREKDYLSRKMLHSFNSVMVFLKKYSEGLSEDLKYDVSYLIQRHEIGGDRDINGDLLTYYNKEGHNLNLLADYLFWADKMTFFNLEFKEYAKRGKERLSHKIRFSIEGLPYDIIKIIREKDYGEHDNLVKDIIDNKVNKTWIEK